MVRKFPLLMFLWFFVRNGWTITNVPPRDHPRTVTLNCLCVDVGACALASRSSSAQIRNFACGSSGRTLQVCCDELARQLPFTQRPPTLEDNDISHDGPGLDLPDIWHATSAGRERLPPATTHRATAASRTGGGVAPTQTPRRQGHHTVVRDKTLHHSGTHRRRESDDERNNHYNPEIHKEFGRIPPTATHQYVPHINRKVFTNRDYHPVTETATYHHSQNYPDPPGRHIHRDNGHGQRRKDPAWQERGGEVYRPHSGPRISEHGRRPPHHSTTESEYPRDSSPILSSNSKPNLAHDLDKTGHSHNHADGLTFGTHVAGVERDLEHSQTTPGTVITPRPLPLLPPSFHDHETTSVASKHHASATKATPASSRSTPTSTTESAAYDDAIVFPGPVGDKRVKVHRRREKPRAEEAEEGDGDGDGVEDHPNRALLPEECGVTLEERIVGGATAGLGSFPWIVRIGYSVQGNNRTLFRCGGALLSSRYVITAAHCVTSLPETFQLKSVRLGEVDARSDPDCDGLQCADPAQDIAVAAAAVHPDYDAPSYQHDLALVRLARDAVFSAYVSPVCLPFGELASKNYTGLKATVAGWGATENGTGSEQLRWARVAVTSAASCAVAYRRTRVRVDGARQMCAGGAAGVDSCDGDSGGPLTRPEQPAQGLPRHVLLGVVSFGARRCGSEGLPGVYTRVAAYRRWLLDALKP